MGQKAVVRLPFDNDHHLFYPVSALVNVNNYKFVKNDKQAFDSLQLSKTGLFH